MKTFLAELGQRTFAILVAVDQLGNAILLGNPHSTISARAYLAEQRGERWGCILCAWLARIQANHCARAHAAQIAADNADLVIEAVSVSDR